MEERKKISTLVEKAHREESKASDKMYSDEQKAIIQREQLDTCLDYRDECLHGLKSAKSSGLSVVQVRECQLLVQYLDTVVETRQYQSDICDENHEKSKKIWTKKNEHYIKLKEQLKEFDSNDSDEMYGEPHIEQEQEAPVGINSDGTNYKTTYK